MVVAFNIGHANQISAFDDAWLDGMSSFDRSNNTQRVSNQYGRAFGLFHFLNDGADPAFRFWLGPIGLLDPARGLDFIFPARLPVTGARIIQPRNDEKCLLQTLFMRSPFSFVQVNVVSSP